MVFTFRDFVFPVNPQSLEIRDGDRVRALSLAQDGWWLGEKGPQPSAVTGSGTFTGTEALRDFDCLRTEYLRGGSGVLILGGYRSMDAVFRSLACTGRQGNSVGYSFEFVEYPVEKSVAEKVVHLVSAGETLWDISDRYGIGIERLMTLNPSIPAPEDLVEGEEVRLC